MASKEILIRPVTDDLLEQGPERICGICRKQFATYACPRCNLKYCSLVCYKSESHAVCTESFYKDSLVAELEGKKVSEEERRRMLQMLNRFEKESQDQQAEDDEGDEMPDIAERLEGLDLDHASPEAILAALTPAEREEFEAAIREGPDAMRGYIDIWQPWWQQAESGHSSRLVQDLAVNSSNTGDPGNVVIPPIIPNLKTLDSAARSKLREDIVFNVVDILAAYAFVCRLLNGDLTEDPIESARILWDVSRILGSNQQFAFSSVSDALASVKLKLLQNATYGSNLQTVTLAFLDVSCILSSRHFVLAALSDIHKVFTAAYTAGKGKSDWPLIPRAMRQRAFGSEKKMYFYLCLMGDLEEAEQLLPVLKAAVDIEVKALQKDASDMERDKTLVEKARQHMPKGKLVEAL